MRQAGGPGIELDRSLGRRGAPIQGVETGLADGAPNAPNRGANPARGRPLQSPRLPKSAGMRTSPAAANDGSVATQAQAKKPR